MKSIKEKSLEVFPEHCNFYTNSCNERKRIGFEAGAEYAIEKVAEWLKDFCNEHYIMSYADSSEVDTKELIEIFKKKMEE